MRPPLIVPMNKNKTNKWIEKHFLNREIFAIFHAQKAEKIKKNEKTYYIIFQKKNLYLYKCIYLNDNVIY